MTYTVSSGTLNPTQLNTEWSNSRRWIWLADRWLYSRRKNILPPNCHFLIIFADRYLFAVVCRYFVLTLSSPVMPNDYTSKCSGPYWSNPPLLVFWHSGSILSARVPKCQKTKKGGLDQYGPEHFGKFTFATIRKNVRIKGLIQTSHVINNSTSRDNCQPIADAVTCWQVAGLFLAWD